MEEGLRGMVGIIGTLACSKIASLCKFPPIPKTPCDSRFKRTPAPDVNTLR